MFVFVDLQRHLDAATGGERMAPVLRAIQRLIEEIQALEEEPARARAGSPTAQEQLTIRELEVVSLIADGLTNHEIGRRLNIELATVKNHVHNVFAKLGLRRRAQAAAWFRQRYGSSRS